MTHITRFTVTTQMMFNLHFSNKVENIPPDRWRDRHLKIVGNIKRKKATQLRLVPKKKMIDV